MFSVVLGGLVGAAPSAPLWLWVPRGADFGHFGCFSIVLGVGEGLRPRPLCGCGPLVGLILLAFVCCLLVFFVGLFKSFLVSAIWGPFTEARQK